MYFDNVTQSPADFAGKILVTTVNISPKTKAFLKEKAIENLQQLVRYSPEEITTISCKHVRREIQDFKTKVQEWIKKAEKKIPALCFSRNIPSPRIPVRSEERNILIALLLAEPLFGNRRNITEAKHVHLPRLYGPKEEQRKKHYPFPFKTLYRYRIAS